MRTIYDDDVMLFLTIYQVLLLLLKCWWVFFRPLLNFSNFREYLIKNTKQMRPD